MVRALSEVMPKQFFSALFTRRMLRNLFLGGLLFASGASVLSSGCSTQPTTRLAIVP